MIVIIIALGIVSAVATVRYLDFQDAAVEASARALLSALRTVNQAIHGRFLIANAMPSYTMPDLAANIDAYGAATDRFSASGQMWEVRIKSRLFQYYMSPLPGPSTMPYITETNHPNW